MSIYLGMTCQGHHTQPDAGHFADRATRVAVSRSKPESAAWIKLDQANLMSFKHNLTTLIATDRTPRQEDYPKQHDSHCDQW